MSNEAEAPAIHRRGLMLVLSSPSGAGKTTLSRQLLDNDKQIQLSVSCTTRARRPSEKDGVDYSFIDRGPGLGGRGPRGRRGDRQPLDRSGGAGARRGGSRPGGLPFKNRRQSWRRTHSTSSTKTFRPPHNVMTTITVSALMGGIAGLLVGGAIFYLADNQEHAARIGIWAAGGVLVGTGVGIVQVAADESRASTAVSSLWSPNPAPTYRLALFRARF